MRKFAAILILSAAIPAAAQAQASDGWYFGLGVGPTFVQDGDVSRATTDSLDFDNGWSGLVSLGYRFADTWRTELEYTYRRNDIDASQAGSLSGKAKANALMANVLYDIPTGTDLKPYLGAGMGALWLDLDGVTALNGGNALNGSREFDVAYQGIAGLSYAIDSNWDAFAQYQYLYAEPEYSLTGGAGDVDIEYGVHSVYFGIRYMFNAAAPAPAPQPVAQRPAPRVEPAPQQPARAVRESRTYLIFFDLDKDIVKPEALEILRQAASDVRNTRDVIRIELTGHTDTTGTAAHNMDLSRRRAANAKKALQSLGINADVISTYWKGETDLLVPTADGVLEPQNRRVEIIYSYKQ